MSDTRFTMLGIGLIFAGFIILGIFGARFVDAAIQAETFGECFDYSSNETPIPIDCNSILMGRNIFIGVVLGLIGAGIFALIKGVKGRWDQDVKPQDMLGPGHPDTSNSEKPS